MDPLADKPLLPEVLHLPAARKHLSRPYSQILQVRWNLLYQLVHLVHLALRHLSLGPHPQYPPALGAQPAFLAALALPAVHPTAIHRRRHARKHNVRAESQAPTPAHRLRYSAPGPPVYRLPPGLHLLRRQFHSLLTLPPPWLLPDRQSVRFQVHPASLQKRGQNISDRKALHWFRLPILPAVPAVKYHLALQIPPAVA